MVSYFLHFVSCFHFSSCFFGSFRYACGAAGAWWASGFRCALNAQTTSDAWGDLPKLVVWVPSNRILLANSKVPILDLVEMWYNLVVDERCLKPKPWPFTTSYELVLAESSRWCLVVQAVGMFKRCWIEVKKKDICPIFNWFYCKINGP